MKLKIGNRVVQIDVSETPKEEIPEGYLLVRQLIRDLSDDTPTYLLSKRHEALSFFDTIEDPRLLNHLRRLTAQAFNSLSRGGYLTIGEAKKADLDEMIITGRHFGPALAKFARIVLS